MSNRTDIIERYTKLINRKKEGLRISKDRQVIGKQKDRALRHISSHDVLKKRAYRAANKYIRAKYGNSEDFHKMSPQEKSAVNQAIDRHDLTAMVAQRMMPEIQRQDSQRIKSKTKEKKVKKIGSQKTKLTKSKKVKEELEMNNELDRLFLERFGSQASSSDETGSLLTNTQPPRTDKQKQKKISNPKNQIIIYNKFKGEKKNESAVFKSLQKKAEKSGYDLELLGEVYNRGWNELDEGNDQERQQTAFNRVNSFISGGKAAEVDRDLTENTLIEISKKLAKNYLDRSRRDLATAQHNVERAKVFGDASDKDEKIAKKRAAGISKAATIAVEETQLTEVSKDLAKRYLTKRGSTYQDYHAKQAAAHSEKAAKAKAKYGSDDWETKHHEKEAKSASSRAKAIDRAKKKVPGYDHEKELKAHVDKSQAMVKKYGHKYQNTPHGGGYVVGHDPDKEGHAILRVSTGKGVRSKNNNPTKDVSVHTKHLSEERELSENAVKALKMFSEGKMKELSHDLKNLDAGNFKKKYGKTREHMNLALNTAHKTNNSNREFQKEETKVVGNYLDNSGTKLSVHQNPNDKKHHMLVNKGQVVKSWHDKSKEDIHNELSKSGLKGGMNEMKLAPKDREVGTDSLVDTFKDDTPGEKPGKSDKLNEDIKKKYPVGSRIPVKGMSPRKPEAITKLWVSGHTNDGKIVAHKSNPMRKSFNQFGSHPSQNSPYHIHPDQIHKEETVMETAKTADQQPVIIPAHRDAYGNLIPAKVVKRRVNRKIVNRDDNPNDGKDPGDEEQ